MLSTFFNSALTDPQPRSEIGLCQHDHHFTLVVQGYKLPIWSTGPEDAPAPKIWWSSAISGGPVKTMLGKDILVACQTTATQYFEQSDDYFI